MLFDTLQKHRGKNAKTSAKCNKPNNIIQRVVIGLKHVRHVLAHDVGGELLTDVRNEAGMSRYYA